VKNVQLAATVKAMFLDFIDDIQQSFNALDVSLVNSRDTDIQGGPGTTQ
jgi:hypothetical protein